MATAPLPPTTPAATGRSTPACNPPCEGQWLFGRYRLDPSKQRLHADDRTRDLDARACAVLLCLLDHAEEVVPRATLIAEAWPGAETVFDSAVSKVMRRLRTALGDHSGHVLQTVYGEGYRLALPAVLLPPAPGTGTGDDASPQATTIPDPVPVPPTANAPPSPTPHRLARASPGGWPLWLPWAIAALATLAATALAWLLLTRPPGTG
ncbi:winged helix-turn-helix domain-containing protein [Luteimonas sp. A649]